ncbi:sterol desaturase family protein [Candidatus Woesearchaeota archaeon]|nr:sterol desaturase family protein [Candidatus Woesearchaeota archaeon]
MNLETLTTIKPIVLVIVLFLLYLLELAFPFYSDKKGKFKHAVKNLSLGFLNTLIVSFLFASLVLFATKSQFANKYGMINTLNMPWFVEIVIVFLLFDLWMYSWHVMNHKFPLLWRFHKVHHSDRAVDSTSALRFHTFEIMISTLARVGIILILGLSLWHIVLYEIFLLPVILFHHSNINFAERYDKKYRAVFASPHMHWIHHSDLQVETDSNYGSIFSFWDRIFKTFRLRKDPLNIVRGLKQYQASKWNTFIGMLKTPFTKEK